MTSERNGRHGAQRPPGRAEASEAGPSPDGDDALGGHADFIRRGPVLWNAFRQNNPNIVPDLTRLALDWCERRLGVRDGGPADLKFARLQEADLCFADLEGADLEAADLARADLQHARLVDAKLNAADLIEARLDHADLAGARAKKADLGGCALRFARLGAADFRGADLSGADLLHAQCRDTDFAGADLTNARLDHTDLAGAKLAGANLAGASLHHARNLTRDQLEEAQGSDMTSLPPDLEGVVSWSEARKNTLKSRRSSLPAEGSNGAHRGSRFKPAAWISGAAVLALLAAGLALQPRSDAIPLSMAISSGGPDQAPRETQRAVKPDAYAAFLPPAATARSGAAQALAAAKPAEGLAPSKAQEFASTSASVEAAQQVDPITTAAMPKVDASTEVTPAAADATARIAATPMAAPAKLAAADEIAQPEAEAAARVDAMSAAAAARVGAAPDVAPSAVSAAAIADMDETAEIVPASVSTGSPDAEVHAAAPAAGSLVETPEAVLSAAEPDEVDSAQAETVSAPSVEWRAPALRLVGDPHLDLPVPDVAMVLVASRVEALRAIVPKRAARAIEVAALPGEAQPGAAAPVEAPVEAGPPEPMLLAVSLLEQKLNVYRGLELIETTKVSSGARGYETRTGVFSILEKKRYHHSNLYSNAPMPYMQRLTRSGTALHAGVVPNYPASHGCIRLPFSFAPQLFKITQVGGNVVVAGPMPEPRLIDHPKLFHPAAVQSEAVAEEKKAPPPLRMLVTRRTERDTLISVQRRLADLGYLEPQRFTGKRGGATTVAIKEFQKANGLRANGEVTDELVESLHEAAGKPQPPAGHLFVRQGYKRLFDVPVAFENPAQPLGTHAFTAMQFAPEDEKASWATVTVEGDAVAALDRIEIPDEAREKIAERLTPGATFIIADKSEHSAILPEGDDFIISATEIPSSGPKLAAASPAPQSVKKAKPRAKYVTKPRRTVRHYYYPPPRARRGFFFRW